MINNSRIQSCYFKIKPIVIVNPSYCKIQINIINLSIQLLSIMLNLSYKFPELVTIT